MNYTKIYSDFIKDRKKNECNLEEGYEKHHILPKCVGGTDDKENIIKLIPSDHYFAHLLLIKMFMQIGTEIDVKKLTYSANMMANTSPNNLFRINHKTVGWLRSKFIDNHPCKDEKTKKKLSKSLKRHYDNIKMQKLEDMNNNGIFPFTELKYKDIDGIIRPVRQRRHKRKRVQKKETNEKRSISAKKYLENLKEDEFNDRMNNSFLKYKDDPEWQKKRGESISKGKKGKTTNQTEIMGRRYASMTDEEFEKFLNTKKNSSRKRLTNMRKKYL